MQQPPLGDKAYLALLEASGCRSFEAAQICTKDIDVENQTVVIKNPFARKISEFTEDEFNELDWKSRTIEETFFIEPYASLFFHYIKLIKNTKRGNIVWEQTEKESVYQTSFPNHTVRLFTEANNDGDYDFHVQIINSDGVIFEDVSDMDLRSYIENSFSGMQEMYETARRQAMGVEQALDDILDNLEDPDELPF